jgi:hypothetical protein
MMGNAIRRYYVSRLGCGLGHAVDSLVKVRGGGSITCHLIGGQSSDGRWIVALGVPDGIPAEAVWQAVRARDPEAEQLPADPDRPIAAMEAALSEALKAGEDPLEAAIRIMQRARPGG